MFGMCLSREKEAEKKELKKNKADLALRRAEEIQRQRRNDALALRAAADRERELDDGRSIHAGSEARSSQNASRMSSMEMSRGRARRVSDGSEAVPRPQRARPAPLLHLMDDGPPQLQPPPLQFSAPPQAPMPPPNKLEQSRILELMRRDAATRRNSLSTSTKPPTRSSSPPTVTHSSVPKPSRLRGIKPWKIALLTVPIALLCILLLYDVPLSVDGFRGMVPPSPKLPQFPTINVGIPFHPVSMVVDGAYLAWDDLMRCWRQLLSRMGGNTTTTVGMMNSADVEVATFEEDGIEPVAQLAAEEVPTVAPVVFMSPPEGEVVPMVEEEAVPVPVKDEVVDEVGPVVYVSEVPSPAAALPVDAPPIDEPSEAIPETPAPTTKEVIPDLPTPNTPEASLINQPPTSLFDTIRQWAYSLLKYGIGNIVLAVLAAFAISRYGGRVATAKVDYRDEIEGQVDPALVKPGASFEARDHHILDETTTPTQNVDSENGEEVRVDELAEEPKLDSEFEVEADDSPGDADVDDVVDVDADLKPVAGNAAPPSPSPSPSPEPFLDDFVVAERVSPPTSSRGSVDVATRVSSTQQTESPRATSGTQTLLDIPEVAISAREQALIERMDKLANELGSLGDQALRRRLESDIVQTDHCSDLTTELRGAVSALSSQLSLLKEERTARRSGPPQLRRPASAIIQRPMRFKSPKPAGVVPPPNAVSTKEAAPHTEVYTTPYDDAEVCRLKDALINENRAKHELMAQLEADQITEEHIPIEISAEVTPTSPELVNGDATSNGTPDGIWF